jgi:hypothetical protein
MSAATPLPSGSPVPPVPVPAPPQSPFAYLLTDPWIAISWLLLIGPGMLSVLTLLQHPTPPSASNVMASFLGTGYIFWSAYFGLAACWRFARGRRMGRLSGIASMWMGGIGCLSMLTVGWMFLAFAFVYAWLGGGIYQFARRWWLLAHGQQPPFLRAPRQVTFR